MNVDFLIDPNILYYIILYYIILLYIMLIGLYLHMHNIKAMYIRLIQRPKPGSHGIWSSVPQESQTHGISWVY